MTLRIDGDVAYTIQTGDPSSTDADYDVLDATNVGDVAVINNDDDTAGINVTAISGPTTEAGGTATFTIVLDTEPTADVTVDLSTSDATEGTLSPTAVTFDSGNWNSPQTVTVTGANDDVDDGDVGYTIQTAAASSSDVNYSNLNAADVSLINEDDDTAGITVAPILGLTTTEAGGTATFTIVLNSEPTAEVSIDITSSDVSEGTVSPATLTFTPGNWDSPQTVTVTGVDDDVDDGDVVYTIQTAAASSAEREYNGLDADDVWVVNLADETIPVTTVDDDIAGFTVTESAGNTRVAESGTTDTFTVVLDAQPESDVVISVTSGDMGEVMTDKASLTFTPPNWDDAQTVTVVGVDDFLLDGDQTTIITLAVDDTNSDDAFDLLSDQMVSVTTTDDGYHGWQNQRNQFDVDGDGDVIAVDVLTLINYINAHPSGALPDPPQLPPPYYDINNDGFCTPLDVLLVINYINSQPIGSGEGEAFAFFAPVFGIERPTPIVPRVPNGHTSVDDDPAEFLWASSHAADDGAKRTQRAGGGAVWDEAALEELDAVFAALDVLLELTVTTTGTMP